LVLMSYSTSLYSRTKEGSEMAKLLEKKGPVKIDADLFLKIGKGETNHMIILSLLDTRTKLAEKGDELWLEEGKEEKAKEEEEEPKRGTPAQYIGTPAQYIGTPAQYI